MSPLDRNHCEPGESFVVVRKESSHGSSIIIKSEGYAILDQHHSGSIGSIECEISCDTTDTVVHDDDSDYDHKSIGIWGRDGKHNTICNNRNDRGRMIDENTTSRMSRPLEKKTGASGSNSDGSSSIIKNEGYSIDDRDSSSVSIECQISSDTTTTTTVIIIDDDDDDDDNNSNNTSNTRRNLKQNIKRASVGVAGGTLVVLGVILSPLPIPVSFLCIGSGLHVLSTEFEGVKQAEQQLVETVGRWCCEHNTTL